MNTSYNASRTWPLLGNCRTLAALVVINCNASGSCHPSWRTNACRNRNVAPISATCKSPLLTLTEQAYMTLLTQSVLDMETLDLERLHCGMTILLGGMQLVNVSRNGWELYIGSLQLLHKNVRTLGCSAVW